MSHKIIIEIESEKEWAAVCSLSALLERPLSEIAMDDLIAMTKLTATRIEKDKDLSEATKRLSPTQFKMLMDIIN